MTASRRVFDHLEFRDHEQVLFCSDAGTGLEAIIAIHSTRLGPAMGGCRMWPYAGEDQALTDALRLSHGMSLKNALAGLAAGGGKAVIIGDPRTAKTPALLRRFGRFVAGLHGAYVTAEDVGITHSTNVAHMTHMGREMDTTLFVKNGACVTGLGRRTATGAEAGGDPSPWTALGVFEGLKAAVTFRLGRNDLDGVRVAVQGLGSVGTGLCRLLHDAGAQLWVADLDPARVVAAQASFGAVAVEAKHILLQDDPAR